MSNQSSKPDEVIGTEGRHSGGVHWGARCQMLNTADYKVKPKRVNGIMTEQTIPWVTDHNVSVATDNTILNPMLRHYFDCDGLESSFRNRGMHYGRKPRAIFGAVPGKNRKESLDSSSSWDSIRSSLLDQLSYKSLTESSTPGGLPGVRHLNRDNIGKLSQSAPSLGTGSIRSDSIGGGSAGYLGEDGYMDDGQ